MVVKNFEPSRLKDSTTMAKLKTKKFITKRIKITSTGKMLRRATHLDHFRSSLSGKQVRNKRKMIPVSKSDVKAIKKYLRKF